MYCVNDCINPGVAPRIAPRADGGTHAFAALVPAGAVPASRNEALRAILIDMLARVFAVAPGDLLRPTRGRQASARARQLAMYLAHVAVGLNLSAVGRLFGRDRTTVAHACGLIEEQREEPAFDRLVDRLEQALLDRLALAVAAGAGEVRHGR